MEGLSQWREKAYELTAALELDSKFARDINPAGIRDLIFLKMQFLELSLFFKISEFLNIVFKTVANK